MTRRNLFKTLPALGAAYAQSPSSNLIRPHVLHAGDTVGLITPSTGVSDPDRLANVERMVRFFSLKPKWGKNVRKHAAYLGGTVAERVSDVHDMFADREVRGIFCIRGGYGSAQLLDHLDYGLIHANPKVFLGYSDITAMHLAIHQKTGLVTFHGPVATSRFTDFTQRFFRKAVFETAPIGPVANPPESNPMRPAHPLRTVRSGRARGRIIGGNLTLVSTTMGTPYEIDTRGRILFIEDVGEEPYRIDRMLTQLRLAGKLDAAAGIIWGECADCRPNDYKPSFDMTYTLGEVVDNLLSDLKIPVLAGLTIGHTDDQLTLPEGVVATLDADKQELIIEESGVTE